jgi:cardiolipin synthase
VRILTAGPRTDVAIVCLAGRASYDTLLAAGVRICEWQPTTLPAKTLVVDGKWTASTGFSSGERTSPRACCRSRSRLKLDAYCFWQEG